MSYAGDEDERWSRLTAFADPKHHMVMADPEGNEFCVGFAGLDDGRPDS